MAGPFDVEALVSLGRVGACALSPDGTWVAAAVQSLDEDGATYRTSLWRVPVDGSQATPIAPGPYADSAPAFRPDGMLTMLSNRTPEACGPDDTPADDAVVQIWGVRTDGSLVRLTDEPLGVSSYRWARRGDVCIIETPVIPGVPRDQLKAVADDLKKGPSILRYRELPVRYWDHWVGERPSHLVKLASGERTDLTPERTDTRPEWSWHLSDDGRTLVHGVTGEPVARLWATGLGIIDVETGVSRALVGESDLDFGAPHLSPDGATVAALRTRWVAGEAWNSQLVLISVATGQVTELAGDWDVHATLHGWTADGGSLLATAAEGTETPLVSIDVGTGQRTVLFAGGTVEAVTRGQEGIVVRVSSLLRPPRLEYIDLHSGQARTLALSSGLEMDLQSSIHVEELVASSADGTPVQSFVLSPKSGANGVTLIWIHGGPISQWGNAWQWRWCAAVAVAAGYVVALPNPRGSTGFGQGFVQGIWGNVWGEACAQDIHAIADALNERTGVDPGRVVVMGGSFGGYMTNWLGATTDRFAATVTHAGLFDFRSFHANTDHPPYWSWMLGLDPWTEPEALERFNPRAHVDGWTTPAMILHGDKDYRVPMSEALGLFEALQARGVDSELVVFPDENHWILKPRNILAWYEAWMEFVQRVVGE